MIGGLLFAPVSVRVNWSLPVAPTQEASSSAPTFPFAEGERLVYQARYSRLILSAVVGRLTFTFGRSQERPLLNAYYLRAEAVSEGALVALLGIRVENVFESFVDPQDFGVLRTRKQLAEGAKRSFHLALFDRERASVTYIVRDLTRPAEPPKVKENTARPWVQDILSGIYYVRTQSLAPGDVLRFPISDEGETYDVEIRVHEVEEVEMPRGRVPAIKIEPLVFGPGRLIRREGEMFIWLSADGRRVPLLARVRGGFGTVQVQLIEEEPGTPVSDPAKQPGNGDRPIR
ncbi:MAG: DUF3108 domain-containing protein [Blastocatellia bacterium]|nr:DUF3108 domain-containing protein [Blastocatellia bacterium]MCS7156990.1 DUF3108 domain-containing protein [Blastocatellia bacterium]MCX7752191.1 DUF3108 domain-containing protein [Blastocatellia bacterium]MDW8167683.1 DUF3108 domain-containing protein [Acidobacteriota bacterium]MDW8256282.1 DUF3108 domain-containing protein [Acidobacteriota bacterium]